MKIFRLKKGDKVVESIVNILKTENIEAGSITGLGALTEAELMVYDLKEKQYITKRFSGIIEVGSFFATISESTEGQVMIHPHVTISDQNFTTYSGHLKEGVVGATLELAISESDQKLERYFDQDIGLNLLK